jgi:hypothetical protein
LVANKCGKVYRALLELLVLNPAPPALRSNELL